MRNYIRVEVRLEGDINRNWILTTDSGTTEEYYSIEGSAQRTGDDKHVDVYDMPLALWLEDVSGAVDVPEDGVCTFILNLLTGIIEDIKYE